MFLLLGYAVIVFIFKNPLFVSITVILSVLNFSIITSEF